ncbi:prephenate dehydrogenase [Helicobacter mustelae]|uniref:prephenate dehydrogenase n=1 Tax=Helicobacter mustelae (strain ATCC 43772 / CCUG 25715 / CIP 103759 / LMG 18044 / NCTC 12198 / R85-136P) TaxID=679897 RepID=D3UGC7_HELM1|nr:prephenate dehydrogenase [Helicobacter mustelae]CBG39548.1 putative prephenate dehydrogenase [Helicobacter mustelae 12198]SQH71060.1 prephenate dehydrogenase [Helicobacter mustelae]
MQAGIIGLGLIGGSLGLALKETKMFKMILGYDCNSLHMQQALSLGLIDECIELHEIKQCDVIFLAIPLDAITKTLKNFGSLSPHSTIIDLGSAKEQILREIPQNLRKNYIGAHPMCGTENNGPKAAIKGLFDKKIVILTSIEQSGEFQVAFCKEIFIAIGMQIVKMQAKEHDEHIALISHLPHLISYALANTVLEQEKKEFILTLIGGGFRDMSRISKSSPIMWRDIFKQNRKNVLESLGLFEKQIQAAQQMLEKEDYQGLEKWMSNANSLKNFI